MRMADSINPANLPPGYDAYAGYVDGHWPDVQAIAAAEGGKPVLSIAVFASDDADCLDVETGDATPVQAPAWVQRQHARGVARPVLYASVGSMMPAVLTVLSASGIARNSVRLWSAHYLSTAGAHICGPATCQAIDEPMDGTQYTDTGAGMFGSRIDVSLLADDFFGTAPAAPSPTTWQENMMQLLPIVEQGAIGANVRSIQGLCCARGHATAIDGDFGPLTKAAVIACQKAAGFTAADQDGIVGPQTWPALLAV